jgi:hypothetical protein
LKFIPLKKVVTRDVPWDLVGGVFSCVVRWEFSSREVFKATARGKGALHSRECALAGSVSFFSFLLLRHLFISNLQSYCARLSSVSASFPSSSPRPPACLSPSASVPVSALLPCILVGPLQYGRH